MTSCYAFMPAMYLPEVYSITKVTSHQHHTQFCERLRNCTNKHASKSATTRGHTVGRIPPQRCRHPSAAGAQITNPNCEGRPYD